MVAYWQYCQRFVAARIADPGDDFTSDLARIHLADPAELSADEVCSVVYGLSFAGHETTSNLTTNTIRALMEHPREWARLCTDPGRIPDTVEEALRYDSSVITWRRITTRPVAIGSVEVSAGARLYLSLAAANHDPAVFPRPEEFDPDRKDLRRHLAFGKGIHFCLGAALARLEVRIVLELLVARVPDLELVPGQELVFPANISFRGPEALRLRRRPIA